MRVSVKILCRVIFVLYVIIEWCGCEDYVPGLAMTKIDNHFYLFPGDGGNSAVLLSDSVVLVIDTKMKDGSEKLHTWVEKKAKGRREIIINTHFHRDHTGGNHLYPEAEIIAGNYGDSLWLQFNSPEDKPNEWLASTKELVIGDEEVSIHNIGDAHTFDDIVVYFKKRKILFTGDVVLNRYHPYLQREAGASINKYLAACDWMISTFEINLVVPGHGETGGDDLIDNFRQYFIDMKEAANNSNSMVTMESKYGDYKSVPVNKAGFDETIQFIRDDASGNIILPSDTLSR